MNSTHKVGGSSPSGGTTWLDEQEAFNNAMDVQRLAPLLNSICAAIGEDDYEAAVAEALKRIDKLRRVEAILRPEVQPAPSPKTAF